MFARKDVRLNAFFSTNPRGRRSGQKPRGESPEPQKVEHTGRKSSKMHPPPDAVESGTAPDRKERQLCDSPRPRASARRSGKESGDRYRNARLKLLHPDIVALELNAKRQESTDRIAMREAKPMRRFKSPSLKSAQLEVAVTARELRRRDRCTPPARRARRGFPSEWSK